jgi:hypothetical protein
LLKIKERKALKNNETKIPGEGTEENKRKKKWENVKIISICD